MTKYFLNSGNVKQDPIKEKEFFKAFLREFGKNPKLLLCCFAQSRDRWEIKYQQQAEALKRIFSQEVKVNLELAFPNIFEKQIKNNDAIFLRGGDDHLLQYWLRRFDLPGIWEGKNVATSSAASSALAQHFWTCDWRQCMDGLGILPIKFIPHYNSDYGLLYGGKDIDWEKAKAELSDYGDKDLPIYALEEGDYVTFEV